MAMAHCTVCKHIALEAVLSYGEQPLSTRFSEVSQTQRHARTSVLSLGYCHQCGAIQLVDRFPLSMLKEKSPALRFREPKDHLPLVAEKLFALDVVSEHARLLGVSYIDDDLLSLLSARGCVRQTSIDYSMLNYGEGNFGLETIQSIISSEKYIPTIKAAVGIADFLCARFILEHAESAFDFLSALTDLVKPGGYIFLEVPDVTKMIAVKNHALVWEDHFTYFSKSSLATLANGIGASVIDMEQYKYAYEDVLVAILQVGIRDCARDEKLSDEALADVVRLMEFGRSFESRKRSLRREMKTLVTNGERLAIFGAGHHAAKYVNFYGIDGMIDFVVDDNPIKADLYVPGTDLQIKSSRHLIDSKVTICLSTLSPEAELAVRSSAKSFFDRGGKFIPTFNLNGVSDGH